MSTPADILHNLHEHTETYHRLLREANLDQEFRRRLEAHIVLEERENSQKLEALERTALTQKMLDHSWFLQKMITQPEMAADLKLELLHHFAEEHLEWAAELKGASGWTVGSLWEQGRKADT